MKILTKIKQWFSAHRPTKRRLIQVYAALLFNAQAKGYITGKIYKGPLKNLCTPGLNCYSCPGAVTSCPLGSLQNALASSKATVPYYIFGIILLYCIIFGRWICGFLCPFGLVQDLLHKIKTPKLKKNRVTKVLSYFKYVILAVFVFVIPLLYVFRDLPLPAFCKYICPAGTLGGAIGLLMNSANEGLFPMLGPLFTWKFALLISFIVSAIFIYRVFCRFFCPLGALYGIFNRFSVLGIKLEKKKCTDCGLCIDTCKMDISHVGDHECISCGDCIDVCPTEAIRYKGGKIFLPENEIDAPMLEAAEPFEETVEATPAKTDAAKKRQSRRNAIRVTAAVLALVLLIGTVIYTNFDFETVPEETESESESESESNGAPEIVLPPAGSEVGDLCPTRLLPLLDGSGQSLDPSKPTARVTVLNFWYTTCTPCVAELPDFNRIANDYKGVAKVIAVHSAMKSGTKTPPEYVPEFIQNNFADYENVVFAYDPDDCFYYDDLAGLGGWPMTVVLDENGVIIFKKAGKMDYETLKGIIEAELLK